jgi:hypothetical protein
MLKGPFEANLREGVNRCSNRSCMVRANNHEGRVRHFVYLYLRCVRLTCIKGAIH